MPRPSRLDRLAPILVAVIVSTLSVAVPARAAEQLDHGYDDMSFSAATVTTQSLTSDTVQSKLWVHDGRWWAVLFSNGDGKHHIYRLDMPTQAWTDTGIALDDRDGAKADVLVDGDALHVVFSQTTAQIRYYRLDYSAATTKYTLASGYPKTIETRTAAEVSAGSPVGSGPGTMVRDGTGRLWIAWTSGNEVRFATSLTGATWSSPARGVPGADGLDPTDVAAVTTAGSDGIGIFWSDQATDDAFYFSRHLDSAAEGTWEARETALASMAGGYTATEEISLKTSPSGGVLAAVKTDRDIVVPTIPGDPASLVLERADDGTWTSHVVTSIASGQVGHPLLVIDGEADEAHVFLIVPPGGGAINRRTASLGTLDFGASALGMPLIEDADYAKIKNPTSAKAPTDTATGIVVEAEDKPTARYLHGCYGSACPDAIPPIASFSFSPTSPVIGQAVAFTDTSVNGPTSWEWDFQNDGTVDSIEQNPTFAGYPTLGTKVIKLTVTNGAGSGTTTRSLTMADLTGPTLAIPNPFFTVRSTMAGKTTPVKIAWSAGDPSGLASFRVYQRTGATGALKYVTTLKGTARSLVRTLAFKTYYEFRIDAYDTKGNRSIAYSGLVRPLRYQQTSTAINYTGRWRTATTSSASVGSLRYSGQTGASVTFTTWARSIGWVSKTGPTSGRARVYLDGGLTPVATIDLRTSTAKWRRVVFNKTWAAAGTHTIRIVVVGTARHPRVDLDAFIITR
jgi:PKD repeat protein